MNYYILKTKTPKNTCHTCVDETGLVITQRNSKNHDYNFCLVVCTDKAAVLDYHERQAKYNIKQAIKMENLGRCATSADAVKMAVENGDIRKRVFEHDAGCVRENWVGGSYIGWAKNSRIIAAKHNQKAADIEAGKYDEEFAKVGVLSWHHRAGNVPTSLRKFSHHKIVAVATVKEVETTTQGAKKMAAKTTTKKTNTRIAKKVTDAAAKKAKASRDAAKALKAKKAAAKTAPKAKITGRMELAVAAFTKKPQTVEQIATKVNATTIKLGGTDNMKQSLHIVPIVAKVLVAAGNIVKVDGSYKLA